MTADQISISLLLLALLVLFVWGRFRHDLVAMAGLVVAVLLGLVPPVSAFSGFGNPATVTVALVLILSRALAASGGIDPIARLVKRGAGTTTGHIGMLGGVGAVLSGFMNNVGALALLMPVAIQSARQANRPARFILMPLAFASILGGMLTLIGTPPNILIASIRADALGQGYGMFDFLPVGGVVMGVGFLFLLIVGWRLIPKGPDAGDAGAAGVEEYLAELKLSKEAKAYGMTVTEIEAASEDIDAAVLSLVRRGRRYPVPPRHEPLHASDSLIVEGPAGEIDRFAAAFGLKAAGGGPDAQEILNSGSAGSLELVVTAGSALEGRTVAQLRLGARHRVVLLGVSRQGRPHRGRLKDFRFRTGDILLLRGAKEELEAAASRLGGLALRERALDLGRRSRGPAVIAAFALAVAAAAFGLVALPIAFAAAVVAVVLLGVVPARDIYDSIDWPIIILLGALIPLGGAMQATGTSALIADGVLVATDGLPTWAVIAVILIVTMTVSDILNNAATTVVMAPIALSVAAALNQAPDAYLMAVAVGASCAFLTPIGHQNNALVMGPGGYRFGDYWRVGLPMEAIIVVVAVPTILIVWPV